MLKEYRFSLLENSTLKVKILPFKNKQVSNMGLEN